MKKPSPHSALGIKTGDIVRTSYDTDPFEVWSIYGPTHVEQQAGAIIVTALPEISLRLVQPGTEPRGDHDFYYINRIRREGERYFTRLVGDEIFVEPNQTTPNQMSLFDEHKELTPKPYSFTEGVDYRAGWRNVWHCERCGKDYNDSEAYPKIKPCVYMNCPHCGKWGAICLLYIPGAPLINILNTHDLDYYIKQAREQGSIPCYSHLPGVTEFVLSLAAPDAREAISLTAK